MNITYLFLPLAYIVAGVGVILLLLLIAHHTNSEWTLGWGGVGDHPPPPHLPTLNHFGVGWVSSSEKVWSGICLFVIVCLFGKGGTQVQKKANRIWKFTFSYCILVSRSSYRWYSLIELLTHKYDVYSLTKIVQMSIHLPVPFPYIHCDRGGVGRGWEVILLLWSGIYLFVIVCLFGKDWSQVQKKLTEFENLPFLIVFLYQGLSIYDTL